MSFVLILFPQCSVLHSDGVANEKNIEYMDKSIFYSRLSFLDTHLNCRDLIIKKGKGNDDECNNYRWISLLGVSRKVYGRVLTERLMHVTEGKVSEEQGGFRTGKDCVDQIFAIKIKTGRVRAMEMCMKSVRKVWHGNSCKWSEMWCSGEEKYFKDE